MPLLTLRRLVLTALLTLLAASPAAARTWTAAAGGYTVEAEVVAFNDEKVVLQREDHHLVSLEIDKLSEADREYLASQDARLKADEIYGQDQVWTSRKGLKVVGKVVDYVKKDVTIERKRGRVYVNGRVFENLPAIYQKIVPQIVAFFEENEVKDKESLESWLIHKKGAPQTYACEGVLFEVAGGDEYGVPFFIFSEEDQRLLKGAYDEWVGSQGDYESQQDAAFELQSLAAARHQDAEVSHQIGKLQLVAQAATAGITNVWEVTLYPNGPLNSAPQFVVVQGRDSRTATQNALQQYPGSSVGPVRKLSY
ncbi:hypothetical protein Mal64_16870 [Pseudobythopirellula maris]|uniref:SLA1 homology domain-containing protein n=1 Tax=Pseudobythopirellula maris TaxID=2527991 RepID=A0A5C5ZLW7_9BACT|nr:SHD1 domain-containing protein [Pseudobythopirellula maris]TWT88208.1 hypothetical protein Mal64_16870 [Pseudobythopirellula maris]